MKSRGDLGSCRLSVLTHQAAIQFSPLTPDAKKVFIFPSIQLPPIRCIFFLFQTVNPPDSGQITSFHTPRRSRGTRRRSVSKRKTFVQAVSCVRAGLIKLPHVRTLLYERFCLHGRGGGEASTAGQEPLPIETARRELTRESSSGMH